MEEGQAVLVDSTRGTPQDVLVINTIVTVLRTLGLQPRLIVPSQASLVEAYRGCGAPVEVIGHRREAPDPWWKRLMSGTVRNYLAGRRFSKLFWRCQPRLVFVTGDKGWPAVRAAGALRFPCLWYLRELSPYYPVRVSQVFPESLWGDLTLRGKDRYQTQFVASSRTVILDRLNREVLPRYPILREPVHPHFFRYALVPRREARRRCALPENGLLVGFILSPNEGNACRFLIKTVRHLLAFFPDVSLVFPGPMQDTLAPTFRSQFLKLVDPGRLHFLPAITDAAAFYRACDVIAVLEESSASGLSALAATAVGTPVIVRKLAALREVIKHGINGLAVPSLRFRMFARGIALLLTQEKLRTRLANSGRLHALRRFSVYAFRQHLRRLLCGVLGDKHNLP